MESEIAKILHLYFNQVEVISYNAISSGLINQTYYINSDQGQFVLQRINQSVFKNIDSLVANKSNVIKHLKSKGIFTLNILQTKNHKDFAVFDGQVWQLSNYIVSKTVTRLDKEKALKAGKLLAQFHQALLDFPVSDLQITIPDFHNTEKYFSDFIKKLSDNQNKEQLQNAQEEIKYLTASYHLFKDVLEAINNTMPIRVVHNDTKISNVLFNLDGEALCFIDFDTLMPGTILYDVGDALRSGANTADENEKDLTKVKFDFEIYEVCMQSYLEESKNFLTESEKKYMHLALPLILFEQACRFLTDYFNHNKYYKVEYATENLVRSKTQIKMLKEVLQYLSVSN